MRRLGYRRPAVAVLAGALAVTLAACGSGDGGAADGKVTITISDLPPTEQAESRKAVLDKIAAFEKANPNITVDAQETKWSADTFNAMLAGGTLPIVTAVPYTDVPAMIERGQVADLTEATADSDVIKNLSPEVMKSVTGKDKHIYGIPYQAYTMGLVYNRALFEQAGLDPDDPPDTWTEVRAAAKAITEKTGQPGFVSMTSTNTGGWVLATMSYAFGGEMEKVKGGKATAAFNSDATKQALKYLRTLRWDDNTMGANFLLDIEDVRNEFAAGRVGMMVHGADFYGDAVTNRGMSGEDYGVGPLPQDRDGLGTLGGGAIDIVSPKATPEQVKAAVKWLEFHRIGRYTDEKLAVDWASSRAKDDLPVGTPEMPIVGAEQYKKYLAWIAPHVNVPREHFEPYLSTVADIPLVPEPPVKAQEVYAALDPVVQAVLTREDADIDALLGEAETNVNSLLATG